MLLYHYDSRWLGTEAKQQTLYNVATLLLDSLVEKRQDSAESTRPLVFLAHSMGGLVVAKALTLAAAQPEKVEYMRIFECFAGAIFFGTPFRGSSAQARAMLLATFLEKVGRPIPTQMLQLLDPGRDSLDELRRDFASLVFREPRSDIVCIYEQAKTNYLEEKVSAWVPKGYFKMGPTEIVVTEASATLDGAVVRGFDCNHRQLNRFDSAKDGRYEVTRHHLKDIVKRAPLIVKARLRASRQSVVDDATFSRLSDTLNTVNFGLKLKSVQSLSGDSSWILQEPKYKEWAAQQEPPRHPILWVSGDEGLGKSKAASSVIDHLKLREANNHVLGNRSSVMVAYFFCDSTPDCNSAEAVIKSLIWQLILKRRNLAQYVKAFAGQDPSKTRGSGGGGDGQFSLSKLWRGLTEMLRDPSAGEVYFVINNLQYLSDDHTSTAAFLASIDEIIRTNPSNDNSVGDPIRDKVRWMFLSRPRDNIRSVLGQSGLVINLNDGSMSNLRREHLRSYTRDEVKSLAMRKGYSLALQYFVFSCLGKRAESNTLWVEVVCRLLGELPADFVSVRKKLELLPQDPETLINKTWTEELQNQDNEDIETAKEILRTLVIAYEDPTLEELAVLAELDLESNDNEENEEEGEDEEEKILAKVRACGPLLRVYDTDSWDENVGYRRETRVTFIHPLARDALLTPSLSKIIGLSVDQDKTEVKWQHGILGLRCFSYILKELGDGQDEMVTLERTAPTAESQAEAEIDQLFPEEDQGETKPDEDDENVDMYTLSYPLKYWLRHGYEATPDFVLSLDIKHGFWSVDSPARKRWWGSYSRKDAAYGELRGLTALHVAAFFGLLPLVNSLLANGHGPEIHVLDSWANQPLHWAASRGHVDVCIRLLEKGSDINNGTISGEWTPLQMAASDGQPEVIKMLLSRGADINSVAKEDGTALTLALSQRQTQAAEMLLDYGADVTLAAEDSELPLAVAALHGYDSLVQRLLAVGAGQNMTSRQFGSALAAAASAGNLSIVQTLLAIDNDWPSRQRALEEASLAGFSAVVDTLLRSSAGLRCDKAFESAASCGHDRVVDQLWRYHLAYNVITPQAVNHALYMATDAQQEAIIQYLLAYCGANPNALGKEYGNALTASAYDGTTSILRTLIQYGADVNAPEGYALQTAAYNGHAEIVQLLLEHNANPNAFSERINQGTALQAACVAGNTEIARSLLNRGAHPEYGAGDFTNPLIAATNRGFGELVELLLGARANPNISGGSDGSSPLINAAMTLPANYLELLIRYGAVVDHVDPEQDTALVMSALVGDNDCVSVLLNHGASINLGGAHYGTPLHAAAAYGHVETVKLLLQRGADPNMVAGPFGTVLQAATSSGNAELVTLLLRHDKRLDVNAQGGEHFSALHAAAVQPDDTCLRRLLSRRAKPNIFPNPRSHPNHAHLGTPLHAAAFAGCARNARILLEQGADPNIVAGKHGTVLQAAALKCDSALVAVLLAHDGIKVDKLGGKYGSALAAAVARGDDVYDADRHDVLGLLLQHGGFPVEAYRGALERALKMRRKEDFKLILADMRKDVKRFPNIKGMLAGFKRQQAHAAAKKKARSAEDEGDGENSDFGDDVINWRQDIDDQDEESAGDDDDEFDPAAASQHESGTRGLSGSANSDKNARSGGQVSAERGLARRPAQKSRGVDGGVQGASFAGSQPLRSGAENEWSPETKEGGQSRGFNQTSGYPGDEEGAEEEHEEQQGEEDVEEEENEEEDEDGEAQEDGPEDEAEEVDQEEGDEEEEEEEPQQQRQPWDYEYY